MVVRWLMVVIAVPVLSGFLCNLYYLDGCKMVDDCDCWSCIEWFPLVSLLSGWLDDG